MIERLQKLSAEIFKAALRTYTIKDVLTHKRADANNLTQILSMFPNRGAGFYIFKKSWTPGLYYQIKRAAFKSQKHGHFYGLKYVKMPNGQQKLMDDYPKRLNGLSKRGVWTYSLGKFQQFKTDNGIIYTRADYEAFVKIRKVGIPGNKKSEDAENEHQQEGQEQEQQESS